MTGHEEPTEPADPADPADPVETDWERRRRLAAVFGDAVPETTRDERDSDPSGLGDDWLQAQVPPHHG